MNTEKNKYLAERMGVKWHELKTQMSVTGKGRWRCVTCDGFWYGWDGKTKLNCKNNPDYFTLSGRQQLYLWAKEQSWWNEFVGHYIYFMVGKPDRGGMPEELWDEAGEMATAIHQYLTETIDETDTSDTK